MDRGAGGVEVEQEMSAWVQGLGLGLDRIGFGGEQQRGNYDINHQPKIQSRSGGVAAIIDRIVF